MRRVIALLAVIAFLPQAAASPLPPASAPWPDSGLKWIKAYRAKPDPSSVPALIRILSHQGSIKEPESAGIYVGFLAGVLASNPQKAWPLIEKTLPLPFEDQWIVIRALAYSGLPRWKDLMSALALRLPERQIMAGRYLMGELPSLDEVTIEPEHPGSMDKIKGFFMGEGIFFKAKKPVASQVTFQSSPELIDTLWGLYYATGGDAPIVRILLLLPWAKDRDNVDKLTIGSMAKFTLASNAARDAGLLKVLKRVHANQPKEVRPVLAEVIEAAETVDTGRIKKEALAALDELKRKGPSSIRDLAWWGATGEAAISFGCLGLAAAGQVAAGVPCVIGGALTTGALRYLGRAE